MTHLLPDCLMAASEWSEVESEEQPEAPLALLVTARTYLCSPYILLSASSSSLSLSLTHTHQARDRTQAPPLCSSLTPNHGQQGLTIPLFSLVFKTVAAEVARGIIRLRFHAFFASAKG